MVVQEFLVVENLALDVDVDVRATRQKFDGDLLVGQRVLDEEDKTEFAAVQFADFHVTRVAGQRIFVVGIHRHCSVRSRERPVGGVLAIKTTIQHHRPFKPFSCKRRTTQIRS